MLALLRLRPFDVTTEEGRSRERYRRTLITGLATAGARVVGMLTALVSVPLTLDYLGRERYGVWVTMSSFIAMLGFADLGLGNGLLNAVAEASGRDDREAARVHVSSAFLALGTVAAAVLIVMFVVHPLVSWPSLFNTRTSVAAREAPASVLILVTCIALNMVVGVAQRVQTGYQEGFLANSWQAAGSVLGLGAVIVAIWLRGGLPWLVAAMAGGPVAAGLLNCVVEFGWRRRWLAPRWRHCKWNSVRRLLRVGAWFVVLQLAASLAFASDNFVVARVLGPDVVPEFAVPARLILMTGMVASMFFMPLWPAYAEAFARGDRAWVRRTLRRSLAVTVALVGVPAALLVGFGRLVIHAWVGPTIHPTLVLLLGLGLWSLVASLGSCLAMLLNAVNVLRLQAVCAVLMAITAILLKLSLARRFGVEGVAWATILAYVPVSLLPVGFCVWRLLRRGEFAATAT